MTDNHVVFIYIDYHFSIIETLYITEITMKHLLESFLHHHHHHQSVLTAKNPLTFSG